MIVFNRNRITILISVGFSLLLLGCAPWLRVQNLVHYPIQITSLNDLDTLAFQPNRVMLSPTGIEGFRVVARDFHLSADPSRRTTWTGTERGCLRIEDGASVIIEDMNFRSGGEDSVLVSVASGSLTLVNCEVAWANEWGIRVYPGAELTLVDVSVRYAGIGGIRADSARVLLHSSQIENAGMKPLVIRGAEMFEAHHCSISGGKENSILLEDVKEIWLDTVMVQSSFRHGVSVRNSDLLLMNKLSLEDHGETGLQIENVREVGLLDARLIRNRGTAITMVGGDSLRVVNAEIAGNGGNGIELRQTGFLGLANSRIYRNGHHGLVLQALDSILVHHSAIAHNDSVGLHAENVQLAVLADVQLSGNGASGGQIAGGGRLHAERLLSRGNTEDGLEIRALDHVRVVGSAFVENKGHGARLDSIQSFEAAFNAYLKNDFGLRTYQVKALTSKQNAFKANHLGWSLAEVDSFISVADSIHQQTVLGLDVRGGVQGRINQADIRGNRVGMTFTTAGVRVEESRFEDNLETDIDLVNGSIQVLGCRLTGGTTAIRVQPGCLLRVSASRFENKNLGIAVEKTGHALIQANAFEGGEEAISLDDFSQTSIRDNSFSNVRGALIHTLGPNLLASDFSLNICSDNALILWAHHKTGMLTMSRNTFVGNIAFIQSRTESPIKLHRSIIQGSREDLKPGLPRGKDLVENCFWQNAGLDSLSWDARERGNILRDPRLDPAGFLLPDSPCLGKDGKTARIGARNLRVPGEPLLKP